MIKFQPMTWFMIIAFVRHQGTQIHLGLELWPSSVAYGPNLFLPKTLVWTHINYKPKFCHLVLARQTIPEQ